MSMSAQMRTVLLFFIKSLVVGIMKVLFKSVTESAIPKTSDACCSQPNCENILKAGLLSRSAREHEQFFISFLRRNF